VQEMVEFYVHMTVHRNKFLYNKTNRRINFQIYSGTKSTCFWQFLCPSSGIFHCIIGIGTCRIL